ncbi:MAG: lactococcin 972 family bacteriocin [Cellulomonadaceae bacterium]|nr:lactococcin 972 family bacteriocin [Cellulomonadaceae bacterium]
MKALTRTVLAVIAAAAVSVGVASASSAAETYPGGGTWESGASSTTVWSDYHHPSKTHRSSVQGVEYKSSAWTAAGKWSLASQPAKLSGNKAWWDVK